MQLKANSSCTDSRATWKVPTTSKVEYTELREISFSKIFNYKSKSDTPVVLQGELSKALQELKDAGSSSVLMTLTEPFSLEFARKQAVSDLVIPNPYTNLHQDEFEPYNLEQLINLGLSLHEEVVMTNDDCEKATKTQASSAAWFKQRLERITASNFKRSVTIAPSNPSLSLINSICYPLEVQFKIQATEWGKKHEKTALLVYKSEQSKSHENFILESVGFYINPSYPNIGASPDGFVSGTCGGLGCLEVKCPVSVLESSLEQFSMESGSCLIVTEEGMELDKKHNHYFQIQ